MAEPLGSPDTVNSSAGSETSPVHTFDALTIPVSGGEAPATAAPSTPPWLLENGAPNPPAHPSSSACPVCMCDVQVAAEGPESPFAWPVRNQLLHLGCMTHLAANSFVLSCPSCRAGWSAGAAELLHAQCRRHLVAIPAPALQEDTRTDEARVPASTSANPGLSVLLPTFVPRTARGPRDRGCLARVGGQEHAVVACVRPSNANVEAGVGLSQV